MCVDCWAESEFFDVNFLHTSHKLWPWNEKSESIGWFFTWNKKFNDYAQFGMPCVRIGFHNLHICRECTLGWPNVSSKYLGTLQPFEHNFCEHTKMHKK